MSESRYILKPGDVIVLMDSNTVFTIKGIDPVQSTFTVEGAIYDNPIPLYLAIPIQEAIDILKRRLSFLISKEPSKEEQFNRKVSELIELILSAPFDGVPLDTVRRGLVRMRSLVREDALS